MFPIYCHAREPLLHITHSRRRRPATSISLPYHGIDILSIRLPVLAELWCVSAQVQSNGCYYWCLADNFLCFMLA